MPHPHRARRFPGPCLALESSALLTLPPPLFLSIHILLSFRGPEPRQNGRTDMLGSSAAASLCHPFSPHVQQDAGRWDQSTEDPAGDATMGGRQWGVAATRRRQPPKSLEHNPQFLFSFLESNLLIVPPGAGASSSLLQPPASFVYISNQPPAFLLS